MTQAERTLIEEWKAEDSIAKKNRLCNGYLLRRIAGIEYILAHESLDDFDLEEVLCELHSDLLMVQKQIQLDYNKVNRGE